MQSLARHFYPFYKSGNGVEHTKHSEQQDDCANAEVRSEINRSCAFSAILDFIYKCNYTILFSGYVTSRELSVIQNIYSRVVKLED